MSEMRFFNDKIFESFAVISGKTLYYVFPTWSHGECGVLSSAKSAANIFCQERRHCVLQQRWSGEGNRLSSKQSN